jgi:hypothetical protein
MNPKQLAYFRRRLEEWRADCGAVSLGCVDGIPAMHF